VSKEDCGAAAEHVLRPGEALAREQELATPAAHGAPWAVAARRGEVGAGQREAGKAAGKAQEGTWHGWGRTNLNHTGSSTQVLSEGLQRTSYGVTHWPVG
jgi:hypothetical protein